jgi:membrane fusion protein, heavy metal efflux system
MEKNMIRKSRSRNGVLVLLVALSVSHLTMASEEDHEGEEHEESEQASVLALDADQLARAGIETSPVRRRMMNEFVSVPGELTTDAYRTAKVAPRISAQIVERHARLGDELSTGAPLVTLSSVEMADAQGELLVAEREWERVQSLGRSVVSERRFIEAEVTHQRAHARLIAFGLTEEQAEALAQTADPSQATGRFQLLAPQDGTVILDEFVIGDFVEPGRVLFEITDESSLWVEASLSADESAALDPTSQATVLIGDRRIPGEIIQLHHRVNESTRRRSVRVRVENPADDLHPGQFVSVELSFGETEPSLAVPTEAIVLIAGEPMVFVSHEDGMEPTPVSLGRARGAWTAINTGLEEGDEVVTRGAFHLKSLLLRSQLGSGHGH